MAGYLLDTNVLICWFGKHREHRHLQALLDKPGNEFYTSVLCISEFLAGCTSSDARIIKAIVEQREIVVLPFEGMQQAETAALFRKKLGLKIPDAIIAAVAKENNLHLFTFDKEFTRKVSGEIKLYNAGKRS